ncbi:MAG: IS66 family transposase [Beutenbergiaceae bacterium]
MLDLFHATRDDLIRMLLAERDARLEVETRLARQEHDLGEMQQAVRLLTEQLGVVVAENAALRAALGEEPPTPPAASSTRMPGHKDQTVPQEPRRERRKRERGAGRSRMTPTHRVVHALAVCPDCGAPLAGGTPKRTREVIDLPPPQVVVTEHVYLERRCPDCHARCVPAPDLGDQVTGQGRFGHRLTSLVTYLHEVGRMPFRTVQDTIRTLTGLAVSVGAMVAAGARVAARAAPVVETFVTQLQQSPVVHLDETGWREAGQNGYTWTASTPDTRIFRYGTRQKGMVEAILGDQFGGVVVSDFYGAYTHDDRVHQYCWAHLWRDLEDLVQQHPRDPAVAGWVTSVGGIYQRASEGARTDRERWAVRRACQDDLRQVCTPWAAVEVPQRKLAARMLKHLESLFTFVTQAGVPPTNNAAERSLRHLVIARKISGGTRSARGTATRMTLQSLLGTWKLRAINPYIATVDLLASPEL